MTRPKVSDKEKLLIQLRKMPIIQIACQRAGVPRSTFYRWQKEDAIFRKNAEEAHSQGVGVINDLAESKVIAGINAGQQVYVFYWLNNRHKEYYRLRAARPPTYAEDLEEELKRQIDKQRKMIKDFLDIKNDGAYDDDNKLPS